MKRLPFAARVASIVAIAVLSASTQSVAAIPEPDAWNIGSLLAAAQRCEMNNFIPQGQVTPLMMKLFSNVTSAEQQFIRTGYLEGNNRNSIYSITRKQWFEVPLTAEACKTAQYALDQYKTIASAADTTYLVGSERERFITETSNGCMKSKISDKTFSVIPNSLFEGYCRCYATGLADKLTTSQLKLDESAITDPAMKASATACYQTMKAEAQRLSNAGQYPKQ